MSIKSWPYLLNGDLANTWAISKCNTQLGETLFLLFSFCHPTTTVDLWCRIRGDNIDGGCLMDMDKDDLDPADFPSMKKVCAIFNSMSHFATQSPCCIQFHWKKFWRNLKDAQANGVTIVKPTPPPMVATPPPAPTTANSSKAWQAIAYNGVAPIQKEFLNGIDALSKGIRQRGLNV